MRKSCFCCKNNFDFWYIKVVLSTFDLSCYNNIGDFMRVIIFIASILLVLIDQLFKYLVSSSMTLYESVKVIPNFLSITYVENDGGAFSILPGGRWFFILIGIIVLYFIIRFIMLDSRVTKFDKISYTLVLSGIIGNLFDRIFYGKVIDYIDFNLFGYDAPIFNFADICIVVGAFMIVIILLVRGDSDENIHSRK